MRHYIAQTRQNDLRREAAARRLARFTRSEHRLTPIRFIRSLFARFSFGVQPCRQTAADSLIAIREMQPCVDACAS